MESLGRNWWLLALRGVVGILFGILFFVWPLPSLATLVLLFGVWALFDGCAAFASAISGRGGVYSVVEGVFGVAIAVLTFWRPMITAFALYGVVAAWAIVLGIFKIVSAVKLRHVIANEMWLGLSGASFVIFGILMIALPAAGVLALSWFIGAFAIVEGAMLLGLSLRLRRVASAVAPLRVP
ncbi:HdeD family acid-resistance protein [Sorangium sp. So ce1000]|uniref:HdeD family acid-resistance protein n=1 Tax=Sorangium sp. So ce1000 TaxID=3133325 RepID=UPI003F61048D